MEISNFDHLLHDAFTPDLSFVRSVVSTGDATHEPTVFGPFPPQFWHSNARLNMADGVRALLESMQHQVRHPVQEAVIEGRQFVCVLGMSVFEVKPDGSLPVWLWSCNQQGHMVLKSVSPDVVIASHMPGTSLWLNPFIDVFLQRSGVLEAIGAGNKEVLKAWLHQHLVHAVWSPKTRRRVRREVASALQLDARALRHARGLPRSEHYSFATRLSAYNQVVRHLPAYELLQREAPGLLGLLDHLADEVAPRLDAPRVGCNGRAGARVDVKLALKEYLVERGITPAFWRLLTRRRDPLALRHWLHNLIENFGRSSIKPSELAVSMLLSAQAGGTDELPKDFLMTEALDGMAVHTDKRDREVISAAQPLMVFLGRLRRLSKAASSDEQLRVNEVCGDIIAWAVREHLQSNGVLLERAGLSTILRLANAERAECFDRYQRMAPFPALFDVAVEHPEWEVVPLNSTLELWREGEVMRHCVADGHQRAAWGISLFASIRAKAPNRVGARPLATLELDLRCGVSIDEIRGFCNQEVDEPVMALARACAEHVRAQMHARTAGRRGSPVMRQDDLFGGPPLVDQPLPDHCQLELAAA